MRSLALPLVAGSLLVLTGCGTQPVDVAAVSHNADSVQLLVVVDSCNRDPDVLVSESDEIHVSASVSRRFSLSGEDDCQDVVNVALREPVGERAVIDARTGLEVPVNGAELQTGALELKGD